MDRLLPHLQDVFLALLRPVLEPGDRTWWVGLLLTGLVALAVWWVRRPGNWTMGRLWRLLKHRSCALDLQIYVGRQLLRLLTGAPALAGAWWLATREVLWLDATLGVPEPSTLSPVFASLLYSVVLFVCWDASRWTLHYLAHRVPVLWAFHQVHHSAEVLTPLTFHRIHPVESLLAQARSGLVTGVVAGVFYWLFRGTAVSAAILGVPVFGLLLNVTTGNLRHSHIWIRYPAWLERWLLSPAQHQIHHSADPRECHSNFGTWLAVWDRAAGSLITAERRPVRYGVPTGTRNHGDDLLSAWLAPCKALIPVLGRGSRQGAG